MPLGNSTNKHKHEHKNDTHATKRLTGPCHLEQYHKQEEENAKESDSTDDPYSDCAPTNEHENSTNIEYEHQHQHQHEHDTHTTKRSTEPYHRKQQNEEDEEKVETKTNNPTENKSDPRDKTTECYCGRGQSISTTRTEQP